MVVNDGAQRCNLQHIKSCHPECRSKFCTVSLRGKGTKGRNRWAEKRQGRSGGVRGGGMGVNGIASILFLTFIYWSAPGGLDASWRGGMRARKGRSKSLGRRNGTRGTAGERGMGVRGEGRGRTQVCRWLTSTLPHWTPTGELTWGTLVTYML